MSKLTFVFRTTMIATWTALVGACATQPSPEDIARATEGYVADVNKIFVVDCLLPGQVRRLGSQVTYITARRPIRTSAADCEVRGGEYVAYDRANYTSALQVWLPKAEEGDAAAQLYVGQIYEKGLGRAPDYQAAAAWYKKAADQGNAQAQINLGHLYEQGLGVPKDVAMAAQWYGKATGLSGSGLAFAPAIAASESAKAAEVEAERLRSELGQTQKQLMELQTALRHSQDELEATRRTLAAPRTDSEPRKLPTSGEGKPVQPPKTPSKDAERRSETPRASTPVGPLKASEAPGEDRMREELRRKEAQLRNLQARLDETTAALRIEQKRRLELSSVQRSTQTPPSDNAYTRAREQLLASEHELTEKMADYQKKSSELTDLLTRPETAEGEKTRTTIATLKQELASLGKEISALKGKIDTQRSKVSELEQKGPTLARGGPDIEILKPTLTSTRGIPSIRVMAGAEEIVGKVHAPAGLQTLLVNDQSYTTDASGLFKIPLKGEAAKQPLRIVAIDKKNAHADLSIQLVADPGAATETPAESPSRTSGTERPADVDFGKFYALIIGNDQYAAYPALKTAVNDAKSMDVILRERYGFKTKLLLNAKRHEILTAIHELNTKLTDRDNLLIYYAGHGEIDPKGENGYWLPTDAEVGNPANWISSKSVTDLLSIMPAKHVMVVADSCYSGALSGSAVAKLPERVDESKRAKWLKVMTTRKARTLLTSGGVQPVADEGGGGHSVFANAFLKVLRSNQRVMEDYEIFNEVAGQVRAASARTGLSQSPQYAALQHAGHEGSPFFFVPAGG